MAKDKDYAVGYGKPPKNTQFKRGQSGNPSGKRKKAPTHSEIIERELSRRVTITESGVTKRMTKRELMGKALVNKALRGDRHAINKVMELDRLGTYGPPGDEDGVMHITLSFPEEEERARQAELERRLREDDDPFAD